MFNLLIYKKIYHNNRELKEIYTMHSKQVHNMYRFMYHYICKLRINIISQYFCHPGKYEYFPLICQPWVGLSHFVRPSGYRYNMVCSAISSYSFGATALIFCMMFIHIMEVCMSTGFWFSWNILKMTGSWSPGLAGKYQWREFPVVITGNYRPGKYSKF